jgi:hypothetical protein
MEFIFGLHPWFLSCHWNVLNCKFSLNHLFLGSGLLRKDINRSDLNEEKPASPWELGGRKKSWSVPLGRVASVTSLGRFPLAGEQHDCHPLLFWVFSWSFYNLECLQGSVLPSPIWKRFKPHKIYKTKISHIMGSAEGGKHRPIACV